ncbi:nuclear transport factor [Paramyrothecium foliicola]|nr:nuclear transport factor [Paramyrothecium foliicola]
MARASACTVRDCDLITVQIDVVPDDQEFEFLPEAPPTKHVCAAETFVNNYYQAINDRSSNLATFYINSSPKYSSTKADISINGAVVDTPENYLRLLESQGNDVRYEIESLDAHVMNPSFQLGAPENLNDNAKVERNGGRMSIVVVAMGKVQFGKGRDAPQKMFNETFVLVPNWDALARNPPRGLKRYLIMSQNFRAL